MRKRISITADPAGLRRLKVDYSQRVAEGLGNLVIGGIIDKRPPVTEVTPISAIQGITLYAHPDLDSTEIAMEPSTQQAAKQLLSLLEGNPQNCLMMQARYGTNVPGIMIRVLNDIMTKGTV